MRNINMFSFLLILMASCHNNKSTFSSDISVSDKKIILSSIELKDSIYYFDEEKAQSKGLSDNLILKTKKEISNVNKDIREAINLPNSTIELTDPKDLNIDSIFLKNN